jgi:hypothetical protein
MGTRSPHWISQGRDVSVAYDRAELREGAECPGGLTVEAFLLDGDAGLGL